METEIKKIVVKKLKEHNFDKDNGIGVLFLLEKNNNVDDNYKKMNSFLDKENITRNDIFEYAFEITETKKQNYIIEK